MTVTENVNYKNKYTVLVLAPNKNSKILKTTP